VQAVGRRSANEQVPILLITSQPVLPSGLGLRAAVSPYLMGSARLHGLSIDDNLVSMSWRDRDPGAEVLLDLDGQVLVVDAKGGYWVRFSVDRVASTPERPRGLKYSLTLHGPDGSRLIGFDNAHPVRESRGPGGKSQGPLDHKHRLETVRPYRFKDAATLIEDFWTEGDKLLREKGVI